MSTDVSVAQGPEGVATPSLAVPKSPPRWRLVVNRLVRSKAALISVVILTLVVIAALAAPWVAPNDPFALRLVQRLKPPGCTTASGATCWFGTDSL